jgi:hypothetical protein
MHPALAAGENQGLVKEVERSLRSREQNSTTRKPKTLTSKKIQGGAGRHGGEWNGCFLLSRHSKMKDTCDFGANRNQMCLWSFQPTPHAATLDPKTTKELEEKREV